MTWFKRILIALITIGVLGGLGELGARMFFPGVVEGAVRGQLGLTADHPVEVNLGGSAFLHTLTGRIGDITVTVEDAPLREGVQGDVQLHAASLPFNPIWGFMKEGTASLTLSDEQLDPVAQLVTNGVAETGEVRDGELVVGRTVSVLGAEAPLEIPLQLEVVDGDVAITPEGISAAGLDISGEQLEQAVGSTIGPLTETHTVCVADQLPRGMTLTDIEMPGTGSVTIRVDLSERLFSSRDERAPGTCESE